jgi:hypothetical protein
MPGIHRIIRRRKQICASPHPFSEISDRPKHHVRYHRIVARIRADESMLIGYMTRIGDQLQRRAKLRGMIQPK